MASALRESSTYQKIQGEGVAEGRAQSAHELLLSVGAGRLRQPDAASRSAIQSDWQI